MFYDKTATYMYILRVYFRKFDKGGEPHIREILGGNMKTHLAVYEEGLFDLRGSKLFSGGGGANAPSCPPSLKRNPGTSIFQIYSQSHEIITNVDTSLIRTPH